MELCCTERAEPARDVGEDRCVLTVAPCPIPIDPEDIIDLDQFIDAAIESNGRPETHM